MRKKRVGLNGFATLGDETRLKIFLKIVELSSSSFINDRPVLAQNNAKHLSMVFGLAKSTLSHHVEAPKESGLILEVQKGKFSYLFPNYAAISEFKTFLEEQVLIYSVAGSYEQIAELKLNKISDITTETFKDYLIIQGCKNVEETTDAVGNKKILFKITGFNEPFYIIINPPSVKIFSIQKNSRSSREIISALCGQLIASFQ